MHPVKLLAVVLAGLHLAGRGTGTELRAERVVGHRLEDIVAAGCPDHLADVAQMVAVVVLEREVVLDWVAGILRRLAVPLLELEFVDATVPQSEIAAEEVVRGVRILYFRRGKFPDTADGDADVRHRRQVRDAQLLPRGAILVLRHAAFFCHTHFFIHSSCESKIS